MLNPQLPIITAVTTLSPSHSTSKHNLSFMSRSFSMWILNSISTSTSSCASSFAFCRRQRIEVVLGVLVAGDGEGVVNRDPALVYAEEHDRGAHVVRRRPCGSGV
ncbi:hypothetical protein ACLB2K_005758 [Fragaria x ananassa]